MIWYIINARGKKIIPSDSSSVIKQIEVDFGQLPLASKLFNISDVDVNANSKIMAVMAYDAPTGKGLAELRIEGFNILAGNSSIGTFELFISPTNGGTISDKFKINYIIA